MVGVPLASSSEVPVLVLSDVHLSANVQSQRERAVIEVLARHPGLDVVFLGDLFEFSSSRAAHPADALLEMAAANPGFVDALRQHTANGARVYLVPGNHDAELVGLGEQAALVFGNQTSVVPWCLRLGDVHLEHGHSFDCDNAPIHPLSDHTRAHECLGAALMRSVVVEMDARIFAHAHDLTPLRAVVLGVRMLGWRLLLLLYRLFVIVCAMTFRSAWGRWGQVRALRRVGSERLPAAARTAGLPEAVLRALSDALPTPTHAGFIRMLWRLYLDVALAFGVTGLGALGWLLGIRGAAGVCVVGVGYLLLVAFLSATQLRQRRYEPPLQALKRGSTVVVKLTGAARVVFGHTHVEYDDGVYFNLGSFGYGGSDGRPYAMVAPDGSVKRRFVAFDCGQ